MTTDVTRSPTLPGVARPRTRRRSQSASRLNTAAGHAVMVLLSIFCLFPVYWMLNISLQPSGNALAGTFFPTSPSLDGYRSAIQDGWLIWSAAHFWWITLNSVGNCSNAGVFPGRWKPPCGGIMRRKVEKDQAVCLPS